MEASMSWAEFDAISAPLPPVSCGSAVREMKKAAAVCLRHRGGQLGPLDMHDPKALAGFCLPGLLFLPVEFVLADLAVKRGAADAEAAAHFGHVPLIEVDGVFDDIAFNL